VPAEANSTAPIAMTKNEFCSSNLAIIPGPRYRAGTIARFSGKLAVGGLLKRFQAKHALGLDPGVETGSRQENASVQESRAPFRFNRNGKGSCRLPGENYTSGI
jgi:hypothetical protein